MPPRPTPAHRDGVLRHRRRDVRRLDLRAVVDARAARVRRRRSPTSEFDDEYAAARAAQDGSFRRRLTRRFLGTDADLAERRGAAPRRYWAYPATALYPDVVPCLEALARPLPPGRDREPAHVRARRPWNATASPASSRSGASATTWACRSPTRRCSRTCSDTARRRAGAHGHGGRPARLRRAARQGGGHARACGCSAGRRPTSPRPQQLGEADACVHDARRGSRRMHGRHGTDGSGS